jgi:hypothetical protein
MARPLVHRMIRKGDRAVGGAEWACPFCAHEVVFWSIYHRVLVKGRANTVHIRAMEEVPVHLDDVVLELTEADENWLTINTVAWSGQVTR